MKIFTTTRHLLMGAVALTALGTADAAQFQYDFRTDVTIVGSNFPGEVNVNNATLSFVVDWFDIDDSGPTTTANGSVVSIFASISANSTGFESALLNDDTTSSLSPDFSTVGFGTSQVNDAANSLSLMSGGTSTFVNEVSVSDPFGANPVFDSWFVDGHAFGTSFPALERQYGFDLVSNGIGGDNYKFEEWIVNSRIDVTGSGSESVSISYNVGQYLGTATVVPVPAAAPLGLLGLGIVGWLGRRKRKRVGVEKE